MLILVPPSEGKTAPTEGPSLDLDALSHPELRPVREALIVALEQLAHGDEEHALKELKLGPRSRSALVENQTLRVSPVAPASEVYTGVLFDRLGLRTLSPVARRRADEHLLITSALWGVLEPSDPIPTYRCAAAARLPGHPTAKRTWRDPLRAVLPDDELVVDLRSGVYRDLWPGPADQQAVLVGVVREAGRRRIVVSHDAKATRGAIGRALLDDDGAWTGLQTPEHVAGRIEAAGWRVELRPGRQTGTVDLTVVEQGAG